MEVAEQLANSNLPKKRGWRERTRSNNTNKNNEDNSSSSSGGDNDARRSGENNGTGSGRGSSASSGFEAALDLGVWASSDTSEARPENVGLPQYCFHRSGNKCWKVMRDTPGLLKNASSIHLTTYLCWLAEDSPLPPDFRCPIDYTSKQVIDIDQLVTGAIYFYDTRYLLCK